MQWSVVKAVAIPESLDHGGPLRDVLDLVEDDHEAPTSLGDFPVGLSSGHFPTPDNPSMVNRFLARHRLGLQEVFGGTVGGQETDLGFVSGPVAARPGDPAEGLFDGGCFPALSRAEDRHDRARRLGETFDEGSNLRPFVGQHYATEHLCSGG